MSKGDAPTRVLEGETAARAIARARSCGISLSSAAPAEAGLGRGSAGLAVLFGHLEAAFPGEGHAEAAERFLGHACAALAEKALDASLFQGVAGIAWALSRVGGYEEALDEHVDPLLLEHVRHAESREFDLIYGLTGIGVYALERLAASLGRTLLEAVVTRLHALAQPTSPGVCWQRPPSDPRSGWPIFPYQLLGMAHGIAGPIGVLGAACAQGVATDVARPLLDAAVSWLLAQELSEEGGASRYAAAVSRGREPVRDRTAWCQGEPGIAAALLLAARAVNEAGWETRALRIARRAARRPMGLTGVWDQGLCHGSAGLALVFARLHAATGDEELRDAAEGWARRTLAVTPGGGAKDTHGDGCAHAERGLLAGDGAAGAALALLTLAGLTDPSWDAFLLLSAPGLPGGPRKGPEVRETRSPAVVSAPTPTVAEAMSPAVKTLGPLDTVADAARLMRQTDVGLVPIVDGETLLGVLTDRDIVTRVVAAGLPPATTTAISVASRDPMTIPAEASLDAAAVLMAEARIRRLLVMRAGCLAGVLSLGDVAAAAERPVAGALLQVVSRREPPGVDPGPLRFRDRRDAGRALAAELSAYHGRRDLLVMAVPPGGVPVAGEIAHALAAPLSVVVVSRLTSGSRKGTGVTIGAIVEGGAHVLDHGELAGRGISRRALAGRIAEARADVRRRASLLRRGPRADVRGRTVILVDDSLASGITMRAAVRAVRGRGPAAICVAVPVGSRDACGDLRAEVDDLVAVRSPPVFTSVEAWYEDHAPTSDEEALASLVPE